METTQLRLFQNMELTKKDLENYNKVLVFFSGGKDSLYCILRLLDIGVPRSKIELHHHLIDGMHGPHFFDWPVTENYCRAVAKALKLPIYFSWKEGGFLSELLRDNIPTAPTCFECPGGEVCQSGGNGNPNTRRRFPQVCSNLLLRFCSPTLKIQVGELSVRNQIRFNNTMTLCISGERAQESPNRAKYAYLEPDRADARKGNKKRWVDRCRLAHQITEDEVWDLMRFYKLECHPSYRLGFSRCSCLHCIFSGNDQLAEAQYVDPDGFHYISELESEFGVTIHRTLSILERVKKGKPMVIDNDLVRMAMSTEWNRPIFVDNWTLPIGAFHNSPGPV